MPRDQFANAAQTTLTAAINNVTTTLTVQSATAFPATVQFRILIDLEIMIVTAGAGTTTWTVLRGQEGTTATSHANNSTVSQVLTAGSCARFAQVSDLAPVHGRLTLATGAPYYSPVNYQTPSSTSTGADTVTFPADHGWQTGTIVYADVTGGGLTAFTFYYVRSISSTSVAFYTTLANALADTSRVNLTASITANIFGIGIGSQTLYWSPVGIGNGIELYSNGDWARYSFTELSLPLAQTQTGTTTNGNATITGLSNTSQLVRGMQVTGTGIPANTTIATIPSATSVTLNNNATATGSPSLSFKLPPSTPGTTGSLYDVFGIVSSGAAKIQFGTKWTNNSTRGVALSTQDGVLVNDTVIASGDSNSIAAKTGRYLGTISVAGTAGESEDSERARLCWNLYNPVPRALRRTADATSWTYGTNFWRFFNNDSTVRVDIVVGWYSAFLELGCVLNAGFAASASWAAAIFNIQGNTSSSGNINRSFNTRPGSASNIVASHAYVWRVPFVGYDSYGAYEIADASVTYNAYSQDPQPGRYMSGLFGSLLG